MGAMEKNQTPSDEERARRSAKGNLRDLIADTLLLSEQGGCYVSAYDRDCADYGEYQDAAGTVMPLVVGLDSSALRGLVDELKAIDWVEERPEHLATPEACAEWLRERVGKVRA